MPRVTITQIAKASGLCHQTVSRILSGKAEKHRPATVEKVMAVAERLGYRPHAGARLMRSGKTGNAALILDANRVRSGMPHGLLDGILAGLEGHGLGLHVVRYSDQQLNDESYVPKILKEISSDGLIANINMALPRRMASLVKRYRIPLVWLNNKRRTDAVYPDDYEAARELVRRLVEDGRRKIAFVCHGWDQGEYQHYSKDDRLAGYRDALKDAGLRRREVLVGGGKPYREAIRIHEELFEGSDCPDALVTYGDAEIKFMALRMAARAWERVRDGVQLAMFGHTEEFFDPTIAGMSLNAPRVGRAAVEILADKMAAPEKTLDSRRIAFKYRAGRKG